MRDYYNEGEEARANGYFPSVCPYVHSSVAYREWMEGYYNV